MQSRKWEREKSNREWNRGKISAKTIEEGRSKPKNFRKKKLKEKKREEKQ